MVVEGQCLEDLRSSILRGPLHPDSALVPPRCAAGLVLAAAITQGVATNGASSARVTDSLSLGPFAPCL